MGAGNSTGLFTGLAVADPISTAIGYGSSAAATMIDGGQGGLFANFNTAVAPAVGKEAIAYQQGGDNVTAFYKGAGTDVIRAATILGTAGVGTVLEGAAEVAANAALAAASSAGEQYVNTGTVNPTGVGLSAAVGAAGSAVGQLASGAASGASSSASATAATGAGNAATGSGTSFLGNGALADSDYLAAFYGTDKAVFGEAGTGLTFQQTADAGTAAGYGASVGAFKDAGLASSLLSSGGKKDGGILDSAKGFVGEHGTTLLKVGSAGMGLLNSYMAAQSAKQSAAAESRELETKAGLEDMRADLYALQQRAEAENAADEKRRLGRARRQLVGRGRTAAAANGVMLEGRAESSPAVFEQDAAAEMAYESAKVDYNLGIKNANHAANAAMSRLSAANYRLNAANAKRLGNLSATSAWIQGGADAGIKLASAFL